MASFRVLVYNKGCSLRELSRWCDISLKQLYNYCNGRVRPEKITFSNVCDIATYLDCDMIEVYNAIVESFENEHYYDEEKGRWI